MTPSPYPDVRLGAAGRALSELLAADAAPPTLLDDVMRWIHAHADLPLAVTPPLLLRMRVLTEMLATIAVHDVGRFLEESPPEMSARAEEAIGWCEELGATRVAELLRRAIALLPEGVFPSDFITRNRAVDAARAAGRAAGADPFVALGVEFNDALPALSDRLNASVAARWREVLGEVLEMHRRIAERDSARGLLAIGNDMEFLEALDAAVARAHPSIDRAPRSGSNLSPARQVVSWLRGAHLYGAEGVWKLLDSGDFHELWDDAQRWSRMIGADRLADWLTAVASAFPDGRVPADKDALTEGLSAFEDTASRDPADPWAGVDALARLDMEHAGALDDMVAALRDFIAANALDPVAALDRVGRAEQVAPPQRTPRPPAEVKGAPLTPLGHAALDALFATAYSFTVDDWARAIRRRLGDAASYDAAYLHVMQTARAAAKAGTGAGGEEGRKARKQLDDRAYPVMHQIRISLPAIHTDGDGPLPLERRAYQLLFTAKHVILIREALGDVVAGDVAILLRPFGAR